MTTPADFMHPQTVATLLSTICLFLMTTIPLHSAPPTIELPLDRTAYFQGEVVPVGIAAEKSTIELTGVDSDDQAVVLYKGPPAALLLSTATLEPGHYRLTVDGELTSTEFKITSALRHSAASLQDEVLPTLVPRGMTRAQHNNLEIRAKMLGEHREKVRRALEESGISACVSLGASEPDRYEVLDLLAEYGVMALNNPETRPTSFNPVANDQTEIEHMSQRMALTAQANARYPNFGGFCFGWDAAGFWPNMRQGLLFYWGWGDQEQPLRNYLQHIRDVRDQAFVEETGLEVPSESDFLTYLMAIKRPEFATYIDMPTRDWVYEIAAEMPKAQENEVADLARRTKAYADFLDFQCVRRCPRTQPRFAGQVRESQCPRSRARNLRQRVCP